MIRLKFLLMTGIHCFCFLLICLLIPRLFGQVYAMIDPVDYLPVGKTTPEQMGWTFMGASTGGYKCYDLSDYGIEKVRYVMFLNDSNNTPWSVRGADPDGVLVLHANNPGYNGSGANAVTSVKIGDGGVGGYGCDRDKYLKHTLGIPERCATTKGCACALGHDPEPGQYGGESGYLVLDVACSSTSGYYCSSIESEEEGRLIIDGLGDDLCYSEVGTNESYRLYTLDYYIIAPTVEVNKPSRCDKEFDFTVKAEDDEDDGVKSFKLYLGDEECGPWIVRSDRSGVDLTGSCDFSVSDVSFSQPTSRQAVLSVRVSGLESISSGESVSVVAEVEDKRGKVGTANGGEFVSGPGPSIYDFSTSKSDATLLVNWKYQDTGPDLLVNSCSVEVKLLGSTTWTKYIIPCSSSGSYSVPNFTSGDVLFRACNDCECNSRQVQVGPPWLLTAFGDAYAYGGYGAGDLVMQEITGDFKIEKGTAFFATYIISKKEGRWPGPSGSESFRDYLLSGYDDSNRNLVGSSSAYNYLSQLAKVNDSEVVEFVDTLPSLCPDGRHVYFIDNAGATITLGAGWLNQPASLGRACVVVASGNITVPAGVSSGIDQIDVFFVTDEQFFTRRDNSTLVINGSVLANTVLFERDLDENTNNPAEIVRYDPKYLVLLREALGQSYPFRIREFSYSK